MKKLNWNKFLAKAKTNKLLFVLKHAVWTLSGIKSRGVFRALSIVYDRALCKMWQGCSIRIYNKLIWFLPVLIYLSFLLNRYALLSHYWIQLPRCATFEVSQYTKINWRARAKRLNERTLWLKQNIISFLTLRQVGGWAESYLGQITSGKRLGTQNRKRLNRDKKIFKITNNW